ncbi:MAG: hypothetical protein N3F66_00860 [Spirochaetes bacterium]|nr:hypothetical protein [Spirochaetota bacterium]
MIVKNKLFFILMISFICLFTSIPSYSIELFDTYNQIKTTFEGLSRFLDTIYSFISAISNFLGFRAIALFFAIAFTSAGLSAIGFPKGKISFFLSMVIINILWFTWNTSFEIDWIYTIATMLKTNGILLFPYIAFLVIKHYKDTIIKSASKIFHFIFPFLKKEGIQKHSFIELIKSINVLYTGVVNSLINDYFKSDTTIKLSDDSIKTIEQLEKLLQKLKESRGKG